MASMPAMPVISPEMIEKLTSVTLYGLTWVVYLIVLYNMYLLGKFLYNYIMTLRVTALPNEWVVILNNGEQVKAGIGLSCFRSPWDQVAKFPSKLVKVEVKTQQVTQEMQGVEVMSMIEWTVDKNEPLKAFKNLDLASGGFKVANDTLSSMTSAIVRNQVANSTIDHIIKNRQEIREKVLKEMSEITSGWGVHIATVEVTDVKILSSGLFKDMQAKFREENIKKATLEKLVVSNTIYYDQLDKGLEKDKRDADTDKIQSDTKNAEMLKACRQQVTEFRQKCDLEKKETQRKNAESLRKKKNDLKLKLKELERDMVAYTGRIDTLVREHKSEQECQDERDIVKRAKIMDVIKKDKLKAESTRALSQADYDLIKEGLKDPIVSKLQYMKLIGELYSCLYI